MALLRPCTTSAGFLATPERPLRLDLKRLRDMLCQSGYVVVLDAGVLLIVRKGVESSVYDTGKVLLKTADPPAAEAAYRDLEPHLGQAVRQPRPQ